MDILPDTQLPMSEKKLTMLIIGKRPVPGSVEVGHYFQGTINKNGKRQGHGPAFWAQLKNYDILKVPDGQYEDEHLLSHRYGIMDIVKVPAMTGVEPTDLEYRHGTERIIEAISTYKPEILLFVYKPPLVKILETVFNDKTAIHYGFNDAIEKHFGARVFLCPIRGAGGVNKDEIDESMAALREAIQNCRKSK